MTSDSRTPVIIGIGQVSATPTTDEELRTAADSIGLMRSAIEVAVDDVGTSRMLDDLDVLAVIGGLWRYRDPAAMIAAELGLDDVHTVQTTFGGNIPIHMVAELAERIAAGACELAVLAGGENNLSRRAQDQRGLERVRRSERPDVRVETWGPPLDMGDLTAVERGGEMPRNSYAVFDSALRARRGESLDQARDRAAAQWAGFAAIAAHNPHAADRSGMSADQIRNPSETNRFVSWPYTKAMCANNNVDHAGALVVASAAMADRLGVPAERRVHPHVCVNASDTQSLVNRHTLGTAPGLSAAIDRLRMEVGPLDEIELLDLYACFPAVVALTAELLEARTERPLTVTGGLAFAGAPLNFAAGESLIGMVRALRDAPGAAGLVQGNGGHISKHALATYSTSAPERPHRIVTVDHEHPTRPAADPDTAGPAVLDGVTVDFDRDGPQRAIGIVRFADGSRTWATSDEPSIMTTCMSEECVGRDVGVSSGTFEF